jgi:hypothetical protein
MTLRATTTIRDKSSIFIMQGAAKRHEGLWVNSGSGGLRGCDMGGFNGFVGAEAVRFSGGQFYFVVQTLDDSGGNGAFCLKPSFFCPAMPQKIQP